MDDENRRGIDEGDEGRRGNEIPPPAPESASPQAQLLSNAEFLSKLSPGARDALANNLYGDPQKQAEKTRGYISLVKVGGFVLTIFVVVFCLLSFFRDVFRDAGELLDLLKTAGSIYSGVTGIILGYYF